MKFVYFTQGREEVKKLGRERSTPLKALGSSSAARGESFWPERCDTSIGRLRSSRVLLIKITSLVVAVEEVPIAPAIRRVIAEVSETPSCRWQRKKISLLGQHTHMGRLVQAPQRKCGKCRVCVGMSNADACCFLPIWLRRQRAVSQARSAPMSWSGVLAGVPETSYLVSFRFTSSVFCQSFSSHGG